MKSTILFLFLLPLFCQAQVNLSGSILNNSEPVAYANIIVHNSADNFVKGTVSKDDGTFELKLKEGNYKINVSHINYQSFNFEVDLEKDLALDPIHLEYHTDRLDEIVVSVSKQQIRREIDKTVVNLEGSALAQSGNMFEAMQYAPGLVINNDAIAMLGKSNVRVAVDGRLIQLSGEALSEFLKSLSANDIKEIEIMSNPPARFEAEGNSGIVNIITKRVKKNTWKNNTSLTYKQAKYGWKTINNNFSYQKNKLSLLLTGSHTSGDYFIEQIITPNYSQNPHHIQSRQVRALQSLSPRLLIDYNINSNTTIGLQYLGSYTRPRQLDDLRTTIFNSDFEIDQYLIANDVQYNEDRNNASYNFYFDKQLDTLGRRMTFHFDLLDYNGGTKTKAISNRLDSNLSFLEIEFANQGKATYQVRNYSAKLDLVQPIKNINFSYGAKSSISNTDYQLDNFSLLDGSPVYLAEQSNQFNFKEQIHGIYFNGSTKINDQLETQFGLRAEHTQTIGVSTTSLSDTPPFEKKYSQLFPTFYLKYSANESNTLSFNYGKRINRPAYSQLNPARSFLSGQSSQQGNPFLQPSFSHNFELTHTFQHNLSTTVRYYKTKNAYSFIFDLNDETQQQNITYKNLFNESGLTIMSNYQLDITPWWTTQNMVYFGYSNSKKTNQKDNIVLNKGNRFYASINNKITLDKRKKINAEVNFWYDSPYKINIYQLGKSSSLDLAISFNDLVKGMNLSLGVHDVFFKSPRTVLSTINGVDHFFTARPSNRFFRLSMSYTFGNKKIKNNNRGFGNEDVRRRSN